MKVAHDLIPQIAYQKIDSSYLVWFAPSNQWVLFTEEKAEIFDQILNDHIPLNSLSSNAVINNVISSIRTLLKPPFNMPDLEGKHRKKEVLPSPICKRHYMVGDCSFILSSNHPSILDFINSSIAHMLCDERNSSSLEIQLLGLKKGLALHSQNKTVYVEELNQLKRLVFIEIANALYPENIDQWLSFIHASAVVKNNELYLFSSASGSGKSTLAGLLQTRGYSFYSDDFIPLAKCGMQVYPFPAMLCAKSESVDILIDRGLPLFKRHAKIAYFLPVAEVKHPMVASSLIFVNFSRGCMPEINPISLRDAAIRFFPEAWIKESLSEAHRFMDWFKGLRFFEARYGSEDQLDEIIHLLSLLK